LLAAPFRAVEADDGVRFGAVGVVICHEVGHAFADQGSKYDGDGNLLSWWAPEDREAFDARSAQLITQYSGLSPRDLDDNHRVNGALTIGENIGDLGGLSIAVKAYLASRSAEEAAAEIADFTGLQGDFWSWATVW